MNKVFCLLMSLEGCGCHPATSDNTGFQQKWYECWVSFYEGRCERDREDVGGEANVSQQGSNVKWVG